MTRRRHPSIHQLRRRLLRELNPMTWTTPTEICDRHGLGHGIDWYRVSLALERMVTDGEAEIRVSGRHRYFRRAGS